MWQDKLDSSLCVLGQTCNPQQPSILLLHGAGNTAEIMRPLLDSLDKSSINVAALNLPGRSDGESSAEHIDQLSSYVAGVVAASETKPWLLGHSLGAGVALEIARAQPELLSGVILLNASTELPLNEGFMQRLDEDLPKTMSGFLRKAYGPNASPQLVEEGIAMVCSLPEQTVVNDFKACRTYKALPYLKDIKLPVLIVVGENDIITKPAEAEMLNKELQNSKMAKISGMGHMGPAEAPDKIAHEINSFLRFIAL